MLKKSLMTCVFAAAGASLFGCNLSTNGIDYSNQAIIRPNTAVASAAGTTSAIDCVGPSPKQRLSIDSCVMRGDDRIVRGSDGK